MADSLLDKAKSAVNNFKSTVAAGNKETEGLGSELAERIKATQAFNDAQKPASEAKPAPSTPSPKDKVKSGARYGDRPGEKRLDVTEALKPLGSYKHGTSHVPRTGLYKLHEGEAVIPKEQNTMNAADAMGKLSPKGKPEKKIHKITTHKSDDGKMIHTHCHHHPEHHPDETHVSNNMDEANAHMTAMEPNMSAQPPAMPEPGADAAGPGAGAPPAGQ